MKNRQEILMRVGAWVGGALLFVLLGGVCALLASLLLLENASAASTAQSMLTLLPRSLSMLAFTVTTSVVSVLVSFPLAWALASTTLILYRDRLLTLTRGTVSALSAIPAVVFGTMSLTYFVPHIASAWLGVTVTLVLMSMMRQTLELIDINLSKRDVISAAMSMGAYPFEVMLHYVLPAARWEYLSLALRTLVRCMGEGVAILLVTSYYSSDSAETLATALMRALGVTGESVNMRWVLLLTILLLVLILCINALISKCLEGGRHGKEKA